MVDQSPPATTIRTNPLTEEQAQQWIQVEGIFMPQARKQRAEVYRRQTGDENSRAPIRFVHYTSAESALKIIGTKRMWMRSSTCMADYREVQHGYEMLHRFFSVVSNRDAFIAALDASVPGAAVEAIGLFDNWWNASPEASIPLNTYITSVSEHVAEEDKSGRLSMWRAFGGNATRVGLVFKIPWYSGAAQSLNLIFSPVAYLPEAEVHATIRQVISNISANHGLLASLDRAYVVNMVFQMLLAGVTCLKHEGFKEEREWRAIYSPKLRPSPLMQRSVQVVGGVPQPVYEVPLDSTVSPVLAELEMGHIFDRLIIGPSAYPWVMYEAFVEALTKAGVADASKNVWTSDIPIRA